MAETQNSSNTTATPGSDNIASVLRSCTLPELARKREIDCNQLKENKHLEVMEPAIPSQLLFHYHNESNK